MYIYNIYIYTHTYVYSNNNNNININSSADNSSNIARPSASCSNNVVITGVIM